MIGSGSTRVIAWLWVISGLAWTAKAWNGEQAAATQGCAVASEYAPVLVANPGGRVSFLCRSATPYQAIQAAGRQSRRAIGIVLGRNARSLLGHPRPFALADVDVETALRDAVCGTGYSLQQRSGVLMLIAGDLTARQKRVLSLPVADFRAEPGSSLSDMGQSLTMWLQNTLHPGGGYMLGGISSTNEEGFTMPEIASSTVEQIANRIVQIGPKGIWVLHADAVKQRGRPRDTVAIESYQHYTNAPVP